MIAEMIQTDHTQAREIFAVSGNSEDNASDRRISEFERFRRMWQAHGAMMERAVLPRLDRVEGAGEAVAATRADLDRVGAMIDALARKPAQSTDWLALFQKLKAAFEDQCGVESAHIVPLLLERLGPEETAEMTRDAREVRAERLGRPG